MPATDTPEKNTIKVALPSGAIFEALTEEEAGVLRGRVNRYLSELSFQSVSDLADLDGVVAVEMLRHRYQLWLARRTDYNGKAVDESTLRRQSTEMQRELRGMKKALGIDKPTRDRTSGHGSPAAHMASIMARARRFGVHRVEQLDKALELANQLIALATRYKNANDQERRMLHITAEDLVEWILTVFVPEFEAVDAHFRETEQRYWIRDN